MFEKNLSFYLNNYNVLSGLCRTAGKSNRHTLPPWWLFGTCAHRYRDNLATSPQKCIITACTLLLWRHCMWIYSKVVVLCSEDSNIFHRCLVHNLVLKLRTHVISIIGSKTFVVSSSRPEPSLWNPIMCCSCIFFLLLMMWLRTNFLL